MGLSIGRLPLNSSGTGGGGVGIRWTFLGRNRYNIMVFWIIDMSNLSCRAFRRANTLGSCLSSSNSLTSLVCYTLNFTFLELYISLMS